MKKRLVYLKQLFEEAGAEGAGATGSEGANGNSGNGAEGTKGAGKSGSNDNNDNGRDEKKYSDADLDRILNEKFSKWQKKQDKAVKEAERLANMSAQERAEHDRDEWEKKYNDLLAENTRATLTNQAVKLLSDDGITGLPDTLLNAIVAEDAEKTQANIKAFSKAFKDAVQTHVKNMNKKASPKTGASGSTLTKADIMKIKDTNERQRLIRENQDLFRSK